ncbi:MAG: hypothetical protein IKJ65_03175 [Clostridia bacterium]|nr:hypothetical protein [Clostridia bacterium]
MKKFVAALLASLMIISGAYAFSEGVETSKPITFMDFEYGDTYGNIRSRTRMFCIDYLYARNDSRVVADALYYFAERDNFAQTRKVPSCFFARTSETFKVVGHDVGTML